MQRFIRYCGALVLVMAATAKPGLSQAYDGLARNFLSVAPSNAVTRDVSGNIFSVGFTSSPGFATLGAYQTAYTPTVCVDMPGVPIRDCQTGTVQKLSGAGQLLWATYLGGTNQSGEMHSDSVDRLQLDSHGNVWVSGEPGTLNFPITPNAYQATRSTYFLAELSPDGSQLLYSTFTNGELLAIDQNDALYLVENFAYNVPAGLFVFKFDPSANQVVYTVPIPFAAVAGVADQSGALYIAGNASSAGFPITPGVYSHPSGGTDIALMAISPGGVVMFSTLIGGAGEDTLADMARDSEGNIYLTGTQQALPNSTNSGPFLDFPVTPDALQSNWNPPFLLKLSPDASTLLYGTFLGKTNLEAKYAAGAVPVELKVGPDGKVRMVAVSSQSDIPLTPDSYLPCHPAPPDYDQPQYWIYVQFSSDLRAIEYATDIPSIGQTTGPFYFDTSGNAYLSIQTPLTAPNPAAYFEVLNVSQAPHSGPVCLADFVTQSATPAAPGLLVSVLGPGVGPSQLTPLALDASGRVATQLAGTEVLFDGIAAPILSAGPSRVDVVVPFGVATSGTTTISVFQNGDLAGTLSNALAPAAPRLFTVDGTGYGAAAWNQDGTPNSLANPAKVGDILTFYGTGVGAMTPAVMDGAIPQSPQSSPNLEVSVVQADCATTYSGDAPGLVEGIVQYNCRVGTAYANGNTVAFRAAPPGNIFLYYLSWYYYPIYVK